MGATFAEKILARHWVTDLVKTAAVDGQKRLAAISLVDNTGLTTAIGNDLSYGGEGHKIGARTPWSAAQSRRIFLSRRLLETTKTELKAIAPAASIGVSSPKAAAGIRTTL